MANIAFISHCLLNNLSKVEFFENKNKELITFLLENNIDLVQMPCPEYTLYGGRRFGQVKEQYDTPFFRKHCKEISISIMEQIDEYLRNGHKVIGVLAIKGSPTCGYLHTVSGPSWQGEIKDQGDKLLKDAHLVEGSGVYIEELFKNLNDKVSILEVDEANIEIVKKDILELLK
ncbi:MAG: hypothetical protein PHQ32_03065 [Firmicutes bacterium]|nr:hypothetical protein [Bacillota bacterium]